jgi:hypothetical protein
MNSMGLTYNSAANYQFASATSRIDDDLKYQYDVTSMQVAVLVEHNRVGRITAIETFKMSVSGTFMSLTLADGFALWVSMAILVFLAQAVGVHIISVNTLTDVKLRPGRQTVFLISKAAKCYVDRLFS